MEPQNNNLNPCQHGCLKDASSTKVRVWSTWAITMQQFFRHILKTFSVCVGGCVRACVRACVCVCVGNILSEDASINSYNKVSMYKRATICPKRRNAIQMAFCYRVDGGTILCTCWDQSKFSLYPFCLLFLNERYGDLHSIWGLSQYMFNSTL